MTRHRVSKKNRRPARRSARRSARRHTRRSKRNGGGGWTDLAPGSTPILPGYPVHTPFSGIGKDCSGTVIRPGYITDPVGPKGLPGLSGGRHHSRHRNRRSNKRHRAAGGAVTYEVASGLVPNILLPSITTKPSTFPDTTGIGGTVANHGVQKGGRYGMNPGAGPLNPFNGVGTSPAPFIHFPCEASRSNSLKHTLITKGGGHGIVHTGAADSMRYNAPTAGYRNDFTGNLMIQTPYAAGAFNPACTKTGGSRRKRNRKGGALHVAMDAAAVVPLNMNNIRTRNDFDATNGGLPVKFGGKRRG